MIQIPLSAGAVNSHQTQFIQLGENFLELRINYVTLTKDWTVDVSREGVLLIGSMMLKADAEISFTYDAGIGRFFFIGTEATLDNLGLDNALVWYE